MSAPIPEKDKTPLMLLEERVKALEELTRRQELELCQWSERYFTAHYAMVKEPTTSDPQEPYVLDTKPHDANSVRVSVTEWTEDFSGSQDSNVPQYIIEGMEWMREQLVLARNLGLPYVIAIDPKASPKNLPFSVALEYMKAGRRVRRECPPTSESSRWFVGGCADDSDYAIVKDGHLLKHEVAPQHTRQYVISRDEVMATDWEVISEP